MALLFTLLCGVTICILAYFTYYFAHGHFIDSTETVIDTEIKYLAELDDFDQLTINDTRLYIPFNADGSKPDTIPDSVSLLTEGIIIFEHQDDNKTYAARIHTFDHQHKMLIGVDITDIHTDFKLMKWMSLISIVLIILVILFSYLISVFVVTGTNRIAATAQDIMDTGDLSRRLTVGSDWDDLGNMANVLNSMLDQIQELMEGIKQVSDNIAHDLRTPLTRMRNTIESIRDTDDKQALNHLLSEADHLLNTFNALLKISRIEAGKQRSQFTNVAIHIILHDVIALYEPLMEEKQIQFSSSIDEAHCQGDKHLLFQAFANLIDNAIKFTPEQGRIHLSSKSGDSNNTSIELSDSGPGIPEGDLEKVFQRFYRAETSRTSSGTGLGLSLVAAVIKLHNGTIALRNDHDGLTIITNL